MTADDYDDTTCVLNGNRYPEHDYDRAGECIRCGAEEER